MAGAADAVIHVVEYRVEHFAGIDRLWRKVFPDDPPRNRADLAIPAKLALDDGLLFVAETEAGGVGTIMAGWDGHRGWLYAVAVDPAAQRQGIGRTLVEAALERLAARGCGKVNLQIRAGNEAVVAFCATPGFSTEPLISMGRRRAPLYRRAQVLPLELARRHADQATGRRHQGALGLRTGASATQGRTRPRPLRRALVERPAPTCADVHDRSRLPPVTPAQTGQRGKKESRARHRNRACQRSDRPSLTASPDRRTNHALTAGFSLPNLQTKICQVVLGRDFHDFGPNFLAGGTRSGRAPQSCSRPPAPM